MKPFSIVFEGGEGSGKSTIAKHVADYLNVLGIPTVLTREPGGVSIAESIREIILSTNSITMTPQAEALLYAAARNQHLEEKVKPLMQKGNCVIFDRFVLSSYVYQGIARGLGYDDIFSINSFARNGFSPDLTILLDVPVDTGLGRVLSGRDEVNRLDLEDISFHEKVRNGYLQFAKLDSSVVVVDASATLDVVLSECKDIVREFALARTRIANQTTNPFLSVLHYILPNIKRYAHRKG